MLAFSVFLVSSFFLFGSVENSITSLIDKKIKITSSKKYTQNHFQEMVHAIEKKENKLRIVTYNMLMEKFDKSHEEVHHWAKRLPRIVELIVEMDADVIGTQELDAKQARELMAHLQTYEFFGKPNREGEYKGILYRRSRLELLEGKYYVIQGSKAGLTKVLLLDKKTGKKFSLLNTHFAFSGGPDKRELETKFVIKKMEEISKEMPVLFVGDLNTFPNWREFSFPAYDGPSIHQMFIKAGFWNAEDVALFGHLGPISTFTNAPPSTTSFRGFGSPGVILDHIYVSDGVVVLIHAVETGTVDGHFPSDHMPVIADILLSR